MNLNRVFLPLRSIVSGLIVAALLVSLASAITPFDVALLTSAAATSSQIDIHGPPGSGAFGTTVTVLPNGNIVVTDPDYDADGVPDVGAVYLYDGASGTLISMLTGSTAGDAVGSGVVTVLATGNYLVSSPNWDNGAAVDAGAVTWGSWATGISGAVGAANSLVGSSAGDAVGSGEVTVLATGNYLVSSPNWDNGAATDAGALTWGSGTTGIAGTVGAANSLVGSSAGDQVGSHWVKVLPNGNYVVITLGWDNGAAIDAGAVTWGDGTTGITGTVSAANSLVGSSYDDRVGYAISAGVISLPNGNYLVISNGWDNGAAVNAGAVTWGDGTTGITGTVSAANSLVGSTTNDGASVHVAMLANGNYLVIRRHWDNGAAVDAGAVTWGDGTTGVTGAIRAANSLVGSTENAHVGCVTELTTGNYVVVSFGAVTWGNGMTGVTGAVSAANSLISNGIYSTDCVAALDNGNYVVHSPSWVNSEGVSVGAVTWVNGATGTTGTVSAANSLVGSTAGDLVGGTLGQLASGNYVVISPFWDNGAAGDAGAVTWVNGATGMIGTVSAANSLVGSNAGDQVGLILYYHPSPYGFTTLPNGNYLISSPNWDNGAAIDAGAVTWGDGMTGITGAVSAANSLVGSTSNDRLGHFNTIMVLASGNYVVRSEWWDGSWPLVDAGAVTWGDGTTGIAGTIRAANSLVGSTTDARVGTNVITLVNGNYVVSSSYWDDDWPLLDAGAVTWGDGTTGITGTVSAANSLVGTANNDQCGLDVTALANGNYVVSTSWDNGAAVDAGAVTWGNGTTGITGTVSAANSLVGSTPYDNVGSVMTLANGNYVVHSPIWDNGAVVDAGAITWGDGYAGDTIGPVTPENSVRGTSTNGITGYRNFDYDKLNNQLVVGRPMENIVTLFRPDWSPGGPFRAFVPVLSKPASP